jgi:fido (protein-threonine AMPylation protein)
MARGQDKPTVTGGGVDPYVQQSMAQNKQTASNRLLSAMQEASANKRAATAEQGANQRNTQQIQAEQEMNAANRAMQDRRAAEAEKGRREDMEYKKSIDQAQMALTKELEGNRLDWEKAKNSQDLERAKEAEEIEFDLRKLDSIFQARQTANNNNIMTTLLKTGGRME